MKYDDQRIYQTFEEFEREELRKADGFGHAMEDVFGEMFAEELQLEIKSSRRAEPESESDDDEA